MSLSLVTVTVQLRYAYGAYVSSPLGCLPQNGDSDICGDGFLADAAKFFNRHDWDYVKSNGKSGVKPSGPGHETPSVMFPWSGQAVMRGGCVTTTSFFEARFALAFF